jgi:hypothetical protein
MAIDNKEIFVFGVLRVSANKFALTQRLNFTAGGFE